jgi:hypothetical protein
LYAHNGLPGRYSAKPASRAGKRKAASGGELPEAAVAAARSRDAKRRGSQESGISVQ